MSGPTPNPRRPVRAIGHPDPPARASETPLLQQMISSVLQSSDGSLKLNPAILEGAPPWAAGLLNMVQNLVAETECLKYALLRRGILTDPEMMEARMVISQQMESAFTQTVTALEREVNQRITPQPADPRRSPT